MTDHEGWYVGDRVELMIFEHSIPSIVTATIRRFKENQFYPVCLKLDQPIESGRRYNAAYKELTRIE